MDDKYMFSGSENGPWLDIGDYKTAAHALAAAKASFEWPVAYVAKMKPLGPDDLFPPSFIGDMIEGVAMKYGSAIADDVMRRVQDNKQAMLKWVWEAGYAGLYDSNKEPLWVVDMVHGYKPDENVRPVDFDREAQAAIEREKTAKAIEEQKKRKVKEAEILRQYESKKKPSLEDLM